MTEPLPEPLAEAAVEASQEETPSRRTAYGPGAAVVLLGLLLLLAAAAFESVWLQAQPGLDDILLVAEQVDAEDAIPARVLTLPTEQVAEVDPIGAQFAESLLKGDPLTGEQIGTGDGPDLTERVIALPMPLERIEPFLESGRLPAPGANEVLAGDLTRLESFVLAGETYTVVGRLKQSWAPFFFGYLLPTQDGFPPAFEKDAGGKPAWYIANAFERLDDLLPQPEQELREAAVVAEGAAAAPESTEEADAGPEVEGIVGGLVRTRALTAWLTWAGLVVAAIGGTMLYLQFFARWRRRPHWYIYAPMLEVMHRWRKGFILTHIALYSFLFSAMIQGLREPHFSYFLTKLIAQVFTEGDLKYVGDAYASGNILWASAATFINNYGVQTVGLTFFFAPTILVLLLLKASGPFFWGMLAFGLALLPFMTILPWGVLKTLLSFGMVGIGMAPLWTGTAFNFSYHSITMILELEAYIVASFVVMAWPLEGFRHLRAGYGLRAAGGYTLRLVIGAIVFTGILLAIGALYEATTLILIKGLMLG